MNFNVNKHHGILMYVQILMTIYEVEIYLCGEAECVFVHTHGEN